VGQANGFGKPSVKSIPMKLSNSFKASDARVHLLSGPDSWVIELFKVMDNFPLIARIASERFSAPKLVSITWVLLFLILAPLSTYAELVYLNSGGYSGLGMVPSANVLEVGKASLGFENQIPGAISSDGLSTNVGFGVVTNLEVSARLSTQDPHCQQSVTNGCSPSSVRDLSTSFKYRIPSTYLPLGKNTSFAVGEVDFAGESRLFSSKYVVATHTKGPLQITIGAANASGSNPVLKGGFGGVQWNVNHWSRVSYDQIGKDAWVHSTLYAHPLDSRTDLYITLNNQLNHTDVTQRSWIGMGVNLPLSNVKEVGAIDNEEPRSKYTTKPKRTRLPRVKPFDFQDELIKNGFSKAKFGLRDQDLILWVDQENFQWNALDAAGVALGVMASTFGEKPRHFELIVGNHGLDVLSVSGDIQCVKKWLEQGDPCYTDLTLKSALIHPIDIKSTQWQFDTTEQLRPELVLSPELLSSLNNPNGAFDFDLGANFNPMLRLWTGAYLDVNAVVPIGAKTRNFNEGGPYYTDRLVQQISRSMLHQVFDMPKLNTQLMASAGKIYQSFSGLGLETQTFSNNGRFRLDLQGGQFKDQNLGGVASPNHYGLAGLRYSAGDRLNSTTEIQAGEFWSGDHSIVLTERFWYGDTALNFYVQRSKQLDSSFMNFAGIQLWIPLTPRVNTSFERVNLRGTNHFTYRAESNLESTPNVSFKALGVIPQTGDTLVQLSNLDRNSDRYFELRRDRLRQAYLDLRVEDRKSWVFD